MHSHLIGATIYKPYMKLKNRLAKQYLWYSLWTKSLIFLDLIVVVLLL